MMMKFRVRDYKDDNRIIGYVYAETSVDAGIKARKRWPEKYPYLDIKCIGPSDRPEHG